MLAGGGMILAVAIVGVFFIIYGGGTSGVPKFAQVNVQPAAVSVAVPFTLITEGAHSTVTSRVNYLVDSEVGFSKLWKMLNTSDAQPKIDFATQAVIAVFAGQKPTGGYQIMVNKVEDGTMRDVIVTLAAPGPSCSVTQSLTAPYEIVSVPVTSLAFTHHDLSTTASCRQ